MQVWHWRVSRGVQLVLSRKRTVAIAALKLARDDTGQVRIQRSYDFEYSDTGNNRLKGSVVMLGHRLVVFNIGLRLVPPARTLH